MERDVRDIDTMYIEPEEERRRLRQPPSEEEIARRQEIFKELRELWAETPRSTTSSVELLRQAREENDRKYV